MHTIRGTIIAGLLAGASFSTAQAQSDGAARATPRPAAAASVEPSTAADPSVTPTADVSATSADAPADTTPVKKKSGGLFGKVKNVAKNKVVQQVAKTAACTMLPGGQIVASAIDAAGDKGAVGAAAGAATGTSCMPGMGGAAGVAGAAATAGALGGGAPGAIVPGAAFAGTGMMVAGQPGAMDAAALAAYQAQVMSMQGTPGRMGGPGFMPGALPGAMPGAALTEGAGQPLDVAPDLVGQLRKGKTAVRHIDWVAGSVVLSDQGTGAFAKAAADITAAMREAGGRYRLDLYMDKRYDDASAKMLGPQRLTTVQGILAQASGAEASAGPKIGKVKRDGDPRLEIVKVD